MASGVIQGNDGLAGGGGKPPSLKEEWKPCINAAEKEWKKR